MAGAFGLLALGSAMLLESVGMKLRVLTAAVGVGTLVLVVLGRV
jgi:hypothetical protein